MNEKASDPDKDSGATKEKASEPKKSGSSIRLMILLGLLLLIGGLYCYERFVMFPNADKRIDEIFALMEEKTADGHGIPKDRVKEVAGRGPTKVEIKQSVEVETYEYPRILPFLKGGKFVTVIYTNKALSQVLKNEKFSLATPKEKITVTPEEDRPDRPPLGGGG